MTQTAVEAAESVTPRDVRGLAVRWLGLGLVAVAVIVVILRAIDQPQTFFSVLIFGINNGALYALIALGYTLVYGIIELINFSHGDLFMLGSVFAAIFVITWFGADSPSVLAFGALLLGLVMCMVVAAAINVTAERVAYRRLRRAPKLAPLITAVGLSFVYQWFGQRQFMTGSAPKQWDRIVESPAFTLGGVRVGWSPIIVIAITVPLLLLMTYIVQRTPAGKAMRATAQDQDAARLMGIDVDRTIAFTFGLGGAMAGAAGLLWLESIGTTRYDLGFQLGLIAFTAAVLGGIGNLTGAVLGGFLIGIIQGINEGLLFGQKWSTTVVFGILIALMVFKPEGLLGKPTTEKV